MEPLPRELELLAIKNLFRSAHRAYWEGRPRNKAVVMTLLAEAIGQALRVASGEPDDRSISGLVSVLVSRRTASAEPDHVGALPALLDATRAVVRGAEISWTDVSRFLTIADGALEAIFAEVFQVAFDDVGAAWLVKDGPTRTALERAESR